MLAAICCLSGACFARADENSPTPKKFLGAQSCSSSSCHGGGGNNQDQFTVWFRQDYHHERPVALLETRRSAVIAENLKISDPTRDERCTVCHEPLRTVSADRLSKEVNVAEGVSCENCHGPAENWLRGHTRHDWTTADRTAAGMRDLRNLYVRANACVACHQNVDFDLRRAGHPELLFELDGQCVSEPRHWRKSEDKPGPQIWLVGQAVALREMSWQLSRETNPDPGLRDQWAGLLWLLQQVPSSSTLGQGDAGQMRRAANDFAKTAASHAWSEDETRQCLSALAQTAGAFPDNRVSLAVQARRAERLVLALDRLSSDPKLNQPLDTLFADVQSLSDFNPNQFAADLKKFDAILDKISK